MKPNARIILLAFFVLTISFARSYAETTGNERRTYKSSTLSGFSMYPTIKSGESIFYTNASLDDLKLGDIVVFTDFVSGERVCHRIVEIKNGKAKSKGDNNRFRDRGFISDKNLVGKVTHIEGQSIS